MLSQPLGQPLARHRFAMALWRSTMTRCNDSRSHMNRWVAAATTASQCDHPHMPPLLGKNALTAKTLLLPITTIQHHRSTSGACKRKGGTNHTTIGGVQIATISRRILWFRIWGHVVLAIKMLFTCSLRSSPFTTGTFRSSWIVTSPTSSPFVVNISGTIPSMAAAIIRPPRLPVGT